MDPDQGGVGAFPERFGFHGGVRCGRGLAVTTGCGEMADKRLQGVQA
jgi:hypothetical protein